MLLARTTPIKQCKRPVDGLSLFYAPMDRRYVQTSKIAKMGRNAMESTTVFIDGLPIAPEDRIGEEGRGFKYLLDGLNPERILVAAGAIGLTMVYAILAAIIHRMKTGHGQYIEVPMFESMVAFTMPEHVAGRTFDPPMGPAG